MRGFRRAEIHVQLFTRHVKVLRMGFVKTEKGKITNMGK